MDDFYLDHIDFDNLSLPTFLQASPVMSPLPPTNAATAQSPSLTTSTQGRQLIEHSPRQQSLAGRYSSGRATSDADEHVRLEVGAQPAPPVQSALRGVMGPPAKARKGKAPTLSEDAWGCHKDYVIRLHVQENLPLPKVREIMANQHGFQAELRQYRYWITKWGFDKKVKTHEMKSIVRIRQKRKLIEVDKKEQRFVVRGQEVADGKIDRFMKNHGIPQSFLYSPPSLGPTPETLDYGTVSSHATSVETPEAPLRAPDTPAAGFGLSPAPPAPPSPTPSDLSVFHSAVTFVGESPAPFSHDLVDAGHFTSNEESGGGHMDWLRDFLARQSAAPATVRASGSRYRQQDEDRLREDLQTYQFLRGAEHPDNLRIATELAEVLTEQGRYRSAETTIRKWLAAHPNNRSLADPSVIAAWNVLGRILNGQGQYFRARSLLKQLLHFSEANPTVDQDCKTDIMSNLSLSYTGFGSREAEVLQRQVVERASVAGLSTTKIVAYTICLADTVSYFGNGDEATQMIETAMLLSKEKLGSTHLRTLQCKLFLSTVYLRQGRYGEAQSVAVDAVKSSLEALGPDHPETHNAASSLIAALLALEHSKEAEDLALWVLNTHKRIVGPDHPNILRISRSLAMSLIQQSRLEEADRIITWVIARQSLLLGENNLDTRISMKGLVDIRYRQGRFEEAMTTMDRLSKTK